MQCPHGTRNWWRLATAVSAIASTKPSFQIALPRKLREAACLRDMHMPKPLEQRPLQSAQYSTQVYINTRCPTKGGPFFGKKHGAYPEPQAFWKRKPRRTLVMSTQTYVPLISGKGSNPKEYETREDSSYSIEFILVSSALARWLTGLRLSDFTMYICLSWRRGSRQGKCAGVVCS